MVASRVMMESVHFQTIAGSTCARFLVHTDAEAEADVEADADKNN